MKPEERFAVSESTIVSTLREAASAQGLNLQKLSTGVPVGQKPQARRDRQSILVSDSERVVEWHVDNLRGLFRGDGQPPSDLDRFPPEYVPLFYFFERHMVTFCDGVGDAPDQEFEEAYSNLRRRPDGRSLGSLHDFAWQVAAVMLGTRVLSQAEFEGVLGSLAGSTRRWGQRPISRNYMDYLRQTVGRH